MEGEKETHTECTTRKLRKSSFRNLSTQSFTRENERGREKKTSSSSRRCSSTRKEKIKMTLKMSVAKFSLALARSHVKEKKNKRTRSRSALVDYNSTRPNAIVVGNFSLLQTHEKCLLRLIPFIFE